MYIYIYIYIYIYNIYIYIYIYISAVSTKLLIKLEYNEMTRTLTKIPPHVSFRLRYLFQYFRTRVLEIKP